MSTGFAIAVVELTLGVLAIVWVGCALIGKRPL